MPQAGGATPPARPGAASAIAGLLVGIFCVHASNKLAVRAFLIMKESPTRNAKRGQGGRKGPLPIVANHASDIDGGVLAFALPSAVHRRTWWSGDAGRLFGNRILRTFSHALRIFPVDDRAPGVALEFAGTLLQRGCARESTICGQRGSSG